tara:strand:+ start:187 stop:360 length:174 start_codon:yes stop_codon:yes gene_type:complete
MLRGLPMVGALVRDDHKKIQIVVEYKADSEGEFIKFTPKGVWSSLDNYEIISLREAS